MSRILDTKPNKDVRYLLFYIPNFRQKLEQMEKNSSKEEIITEIKRELTKWINEININLADDMHGIKYALSDYRKTIYKGVFNLDKVGVLELTKDRLNYWLKLAELILEKRKEGS